MEKDTLNAGVDRLLAELLLGGENTEASRRLLVEALMKSNGYGQPQSEEEAALFLLKEEKLKSNEK